MKTKSKKPKPKPKKPKRSKIKLKLHNFSKSEIEDFQYQIRKYLLAMGAQQINGFRFEHSSRNPNGTVTTMRYDLTPRALTIHRLMVDWKKRARKTGNLNPYAWDIETISFYSNITIRGEEKPVFDPQSGCYKMVTVYKSFDCPNALS